MKKNSKSTNTNILKWYRWLHLHVPFAIDSGTLRHLGTKIYEKEQTSALYTKHTCASLWPVFRRSVYLTKSIYLHIYRRKNENVRTQFCTQRNKRNTRKIFETDDRISVYNRGAYVCFGGRGVCLCPKRLINIVKFCVFSVRKQHCWDCWVITLNFEFFAQKMLCVENSSEPTKSTKIFSTSSVRPLTWYASMSGVN